MSLAEPGSRVRGRDRRRADRRSGDRRQSDRRGLPRSSSDHFWLSAWGDAQHDSAAKPAPGGPGDVDAMADSGYLAREALRVVATEGAALPRILRTYALARALLGLALALAPWAALLTGSRPPPSMVLVSLAYASQAISLWLLQGARGQVITHHLLPNRWLWTIGVDLLCFSLLRLLDPAGQLNYGALLVLPVLMGGFLTRRMWALATAAGAALVLLGAVWTIEHDSVDLLLQLSQAGMAGAGLFVIALLASELGQRLAGQEHSARANLALARQQAQLNRLVIEEMVEGVLVVDRDGQLRAINPAGRALLGGVGDRLMPPCTLVDQPALAGLVRALNQAYEQGNWPEAAREQLLPLDAGQTRAVQVRARFTRRSGIAADDTPPEDMCVLILEDLRLVRARQRQDKLAAMGRMSAAIAHEIRNPLAAVAQANALLLEDGLPPQQHQLARIVADNVERLKRIVDDVILVAPGAVQEPAVVDARAELAQICTEWPHARAHTNTSLASPEQRLQLHLPEQALPVHFDGDHLRRVLVNLIDNALRHASDLPGAVRIKLELVADGRIALLTVASDGVALSADVERHLFEPFFSTRSRGSGLGLYICRELCERHGASIDYRAAPSGGRHANLFCVQLRQAGL